MAAPVVPAPARVGEGQARLSAHTRTHTHIHIHRQTHGAGAAPRHWRSGASGPPSEGVDGPAIGRAGRRYLSVGRGVAVGGAAPSP